MMRCHDGRVINIKDSENITYTIENIACDDWTIADNCGTKEKFRTDELTIMARIKEAIYIYEDLIDIWEN